jgi:hypothetical protein
MPRHRSGGGGRAPCGRLVAGVVMSSCLLWAASGVGASSLPLTQRVLKAGQFAGMKPASPPTLIRSVSGFFPGAQALEARMRQLGFVAAVAEQLVTPGNPNRFGLSQVVQLSSAANAKSALRYYYTANGPWTRFAVTGIPGAVGFEQEQGSQGGRNIAFALGPYLYLTGDGWQGGAKNAVPSSALQAAALLTYNRVR